MVRVGIEMFLFYVNARITSDIRQKNMSEDRMDVHLKKLRISKKAKGFKNKLTFARIKLLIVQVKMWVPQKRQRGSNIM